MIEILSFKKWNIHKKNFRLMMEKGILNRIINNVYQKKAWKKNIKFQKVKGPLRLMIKKINNKYI
jgi:hypothetical protein